MRHKNTHEPKQGHRSGVPTIGALSLAALLLSLPLSSAHAAEKKAAQPVPPKIIADVSQMKSLEAFGIAAQKTADEWYPRIVELLGAEKSTVPASVKIVIDINYDEHPAVADGKQIVISGRYALKHLDDQGMIVHEMCHIVQQYPTHEPGWLVEGIADYVRWSVYEPEAARPRPNPEKDHYKDSYGTTGTFLAWAVKTYDKDLVKKLDASLKAGTYTEDIWKQSTGKTLDQLGTEWLASLKK